MIRFLLRRLAWSALVVWIVATSVFVVYFAVPHDVARLIAGRQASEETVTIVRARLGLDQPVLRRSTAASSAASCAATWASRSSRRSR